MPSGAIRGHRGGPRTSLERSMDVRASSQSIADAERSARSRSKPVASRLAERAVSAAKASTVSSALRSLREWEGQQPLMPLLAFAELPPTIFSLSNTIT